MDPKRERIDRDITGEEIRYREKDRDNKERDMERYNKTEIIRWTF